MNEGDCRFWGETAWIASKNKLVVIQARGVCVIFCKPSLDLAPGDSRARHGNQHMTPLGLHARVFTDSRSIFNFLSFQAFSKGTDTRTSHHVDIFHCFSSSATNPAFFCTSMPPPSPPPSPRNHPTPKGLVSQVFRHIPTSRITSNRRRKFLFWARYRLLDCDVTRYSYTYAYLRRRHSFLVAVCTWKVRRRLLKTGMGHTRTHPQLCRQPYHLVRSETIIRSPL